MENVGTERLQRLTPEDMKTFYPQAISLALHCLLESANPDPAAAPLWKAMRFYLTTLRKRVADPGTDDAENLTMAIMLLRRLQLDGQTPLFAVHVPTVKEPDSVLDQELSMDLLYDGDLKALTFALGLILFALDQGQERYVVDRSGYEGKQLELLNEAVALMPRISVSTEDAVLLH